MAALLYNNTVMRKLAFAVIGFLGIVLVLHMTLTGSIWAPEMKEKPWGSSHVAVNEELGQSDLATSSETELVETTPRSRITAQLQEQLAWDPPVDIKNHYPPYDQYKTRDYDPNRWEAFEQQVALASRPSSTIKKLSSPFITATPYIPYPAYHSDDYMATWEGRYEYCKGPRNVLFNMSYDDMVTAYKGVPAGFPAAAVGSHEAVGLDGDACFDRFSRLGPYFGKDPKHMAVTDSGTQIRHKADFKTVRWGWLQDECLMRNSGRFEDGSITSLTPGDEVPQSAKDVNGGRVMRAVPSGKSYKSRTAVLIRTWDTYDYQDNDFQAIRALISELSLLSGGEYSVYLFVNIKDLGIPIYSDPDAYQWAMDEFVPPEFHDIAILWSEAVCQKWYPAVGEWSVYWAQFMPLQWFSKTHPEFDFFWNWEMDARYIGQHYHFTEQVGAFARKMPRKYLWELNSRFYIPAAHGSYANFTADTYKTVRTSPHIQSVWGPQPWSRVQKPVGPTPPTTEDKDDFTWGVGEEADFISLLPLWDPRDTFWSYRDKLFNYPTSSVSQEEGRKYPDIPRRVFINTLARFSKTLLHAMHVENLAGQSMASELWPGSIALQHGLKAVYAPHPIWTAQQWPADYMDYVFNADGWGAGSLPDGGNIDDGRGAAYDSARGRRQQLGTGPNHEGKAGRWSQERDSVYSPDREHNFGGWSWYFWSDFPKTLYWRWLGWKARFEIVTIDGKQSDDELGMVGGSEWDKKHGRMCLPGMLLHPVKNVQPPE